MRNFPKVPVWEGYQNWPTRAYRGKVDWVYSNPPCAPWSQAGRTMQKGKDGWRSDPRVDHTLHSFGLLGALQPRVWSWESVQRTYSLGKDLIDELTQSALDLDYSVTYLLTDGQLHGLPQRRCRFFMLAHKVQLPWTYPTGDPETVAATLDGLLPDWVAPMPAEWQEVASLLPAGGYLRPRWELLTELSGPERIPGRPPYTIHRIRGDQVCSTITSMRSQIHWAEPRYLANNEVARLLGYPRGYRWEGAPSTHQNQMAKAVTPTVARYVGGVVRRGLADDRPTVGQVNVVDFRPRSAQWAHLNLPLTKS